MAAWTDHAIWWHVYPLGFTGAEQRLADLPDGAGSRHRLNQLENWLDYAIELGCSGLLLGPVFAAETHGYDTLDHLRIDPRLGTADDLDQLVAAAHARGLRVALDGVFNHVARSFDAPPEWFRQAEDGTAAVFEGHQHLVALNHDEPAVRRYVVDVLTHWLGRGVDAWRLDAAYAVPAGFWHEVLGEVRQQYPDAWFFGELIHGDYAEYARTSSIDSITQYELWKAIWSSLKDGNFFELAYALERHDQLLDAFVPQTFVGNHDVTRIATQLTDERHLGHALAILFSVAGIPSVYAGDEQAFRGLKEDRAGGDDAIRPAFPDKPDQLSPAGQPTYRLHQHLIGVRRRNPWLVRARTAVEHLTNKSAALRSTSGDAELLLLLNVADEPHHFPAEAAGLNLAAHSTDAPPTDPLTVPPHGWTLLTR
ncbi:alpha amylase catalytic region [Kribbella flavida DSM 17836]|uniref:Alpha amylase catalytic region n=1 Tax=Kribbella flavida (strain DSM 17836 / JCM 10339 / NBRC 14399) TaxID=479435 RepID=D2Q113_KRIFD|nr:alpha-amylase family glycosyl hydrolase [Kribbella flavida]ADB35714.1 alpha amylase catalytic region [Kribbella flavida DSM 17836]